MNRILFLAVAVCGWAQDAPPIEPRAAVENVISALNLVPVADALFTPDALSTLSQLPQVTQPTFRNVASGGSLPSVVISHEPWGEAQINLPGMRPPGPVELLNPRIAAGRIVLLTPDVALAEGSWTYNQDGKQQRIPLFFVLKQDAQQHWRIAAAQIVR